MTTIADNMANVNTTGFRGTEVKFNQVLSNTENKLNAKVAFAVAGASKSAKDAVEKAGGSIEILAPKKAEEAAA